MPNLKLEGMVNAKKQTMMHIICKNLNYNDDVTFQKQIDIINLLLNEHKIDIFAQDYKQRNIMHHVAKHGCFDTFINIVNLFPMDQI